jgi:integrase
MRLGEQYSCTWSQIHLDSPTIELTKTRNGSARAVHLNSDAIAALESPRRPRQRPSDPVFPGEEVRAGYAVEVPSMSRIHKRRTFVSSVKRDTYLAHPNDKCLVFKETLQLLYKFLSGMIR